jgi:hypothetical protein
LARCLPSPRRRRRSKGKSCATGAKTLTGDNLPDRWTVEIIYRDGSSSTTFTELEDFEERVELGRDWITITLNVCAKNDRNDMT